MTLSIAIKSWLNISTSSESLMLKYGDTSEVKYLDELVKRNGKDLYHYLISQSDEALAKDVYQQTWEKVIDRRRSYSDIGSFKSWLFKIARNTLVDEFRKAGKWVSIEEMEFISNVSPEGIVNREKEVDQFKAVLYSLPFLQREAFIMQQEGLSLREIAQITQVDIETTKSRLRYAKQTIKQKLNIKYGEHHE